MRLAEALLDDFGADLAEVTLVPSGGGAFEVTINGELVFSKKREHRHPTIQEIQRALRQRMAV